jgi:hypothetical protein
MYRRAILFFLLIAILFTAAEPYAKDKLAANGDIYYLSGDTIRMVTLPDNSNTAVVFEVPENTASTQHEIHGLSCGPDKTLAFHLVVTDFTKSLSRVTIESVNPISKEVLTLVDEGETSVCFPSLSYDGSFLTMSSYDAKHDQFYFLIKNLRNGSTKRYDQFKPVSRLGSLSPDNKTLATTGLDEKTKRTRIFLFDLDKLELNTWLEGQSPMISPDGKLIAYTSNEQQRLVISDRTGKMVQSYDSYFVKDLNGWIDDTKIVFTIGHFMYENHIGILDLQKKKIYDIEVPTSGEISGICYRPKQAGKTNGN